MASLITLTLLYLSFFVILFLNINANLLSIKNQRVISSLFYIAITIIAASRWNTGSDWIPYLEYFNECVDRGDCPSYFEHSYMMVNYFVSYFGFSYSVVLLVCAIASNFSFYLFTVRMNIPLQGLLALSTYGLANLIIIRSTIAQSIALLALSYSTFTFILLILLASSFHYSSFFAISYRIVQRSNLILLLIFVPISFLILVNLDIFLGYLNYFSNLDFARSKIESYFNAENFNSTRLSLASIAHKVFLVYLICKYHKIVDMKFIGLSKLSLFGISLSIVLGFSSSVLLRFAGYFEPFIYIFLCILISESIFSLKNSLLAFACSILILFKFSYVIYLNYDLIIPYEFFFNENFKEVY